MTCCRYFFFRFSAKLFLTVPYLPITYLYHEYIYTMSIRTTVHYDNCTLGQLRLSRPLILEELTNRHTDKQTPLACYKIDIFSDLADNMSTVDNLGSRQSGQSTIWAVDNLSTVDNLGSRQSGQSTIWESTIWAVDNLGVDNLG